MRLGFCHGPLVVPRSLRSTLVGHSLRTCKRPCVGLRAFPRCSASDNGNGESNFLSRERTGPSSPNSLDSSDHERVDCATRAVQRFARIGRVLATIVPVVFFVSAYANPASAVTISGLTAMWRGLDPSGFTAGLTASFFLVLASEIGDKTFFISALLSMKYSRSLVLIGTMVALGSMTVISVGIGQLFHALPSSLNIGFPIDDYAAAALLIWFGFQNIRDSLAMSEEEDEELRDAEEVVEESELKRKSGPSGLRVVSETGSLVFLAEWGDKSMLATVALAAAKSPIGVIVGGISGHFVASVIAVVGGSLLGKYISEKNARLIGGVLFWIFAVLTIFNLF